MQLKQFNKIEEHLQNNWFYIMHAITHSDVIND